MTTQLQSRSCWTLTQKKPLLRVADVQHAPGIPLYMHRVAHRSADNVGASLLAAAVQIGNTANIILRFPEMRNARAPGDRARASVISRKTEPDIAAIVIQQSP